MTEQSNTATGSQMPVKKGVLIAWAFYDWANNGFATVILTFIFSAYFTLRVAPDEVTGSFMWGHMASAAGLFVALGGPICGATADQNGRRKPWLISFTLPCVLATVSLWFVKSSPDHVWLALCLVGAGMVGSEYSYIFYNAMLPDLVPRDRIGPRKTILISLAGLIGGGVVILMVHAALFFWLAGTFLGLFIGPVQAASRSYMARMAPEALRNEMFGLYAFSGKATAFIGPLLVGWLTMLSGSQRIGMAMVIVLLLTGGILMLKVPKT